MGERGASKQRAVEDGVRSFIIPKSCTVGFMLSCNFFVLGNMRRPMPVAAKRCVKRVAKCVYVCG